MPPPASVVPEVKHEVKAEVKPEPVSTDAEAHGSQDRPPLVLQEAKRQRSNLLPPIDEAAEAPLEDSERPAALEEPTAPFYGPHLPECSGPDREAVPAPSPAVDEASGRLPPAGAASEPLPSAAGDAAPSSSPLERTRA